jgi:DNA ligase-1
MNKGEIKMDRESKTGGVLVSGLWYLQGSGKSPYQIMLKDGVWSCNCPAWRNQGKPIDVRFCKHTTSVQAFAGAATPLRVPTQNVITNTKPTVTTIGVMLAEKWEGEDVTGWWQSEKLDGVRAVWDPSARKFFSRAGNEFFAPAWFTEDFPSMPLDGELWMGRGKFQQAVSVARQQDAGDQWNNMFFMIFDMPMERLKAEDRMAQINAAVTAKKLSPHGNVQRLAKKGFVLPQVQVTSMHSLAVDMDGVLAKGGEGLMVRKPGSLYVDRRSPALLKIKKFDSSEAIVIGIEEGKGRHAGAMGALLVRNAAGVEFKVGGGFNDRQRRVAWEKWNGKVIQRSDGNSIVIELKHQGLTDGGTPRFPIFLRERVDLDTVPEELDVINV